MNMNEKGRQTKLLAAIAIIAMVICAIAVIVPSGVDGEEISVGANDDLQQAIDNASAEDIIVLTAEAYGSPVTTTDTDGNYTLYTINKNLTIRAADGVTPDVYGEFLVNADSVTFENINIYIQGNQGAADPIRNGITFYGDELNVTGCTFHLGTEEKFGNGITFFPTSENAVLNVTENEFIGINYGNGSYSSSSISIAAQFVVSSYFTGVDNSSAWNVTDSELLSIYDNNSYTNCLYAVSYNDYNDTGSTGSIIDGVSTALQRFDRVIVLEDDLVLSPYFLRFMNEALETYKDEPRVGHIQACDFTQAPSLPDTFLIKWTGSWGWATWRRAWKHFNPDGQALLDELERRRLTHTFDFDGAYRYTRMLRRQVEGKNNSWAIRWNASLFLADILSLNVGRSLVQNTGFDGSGTHCGGGGLYASTLWMKPLPVVRISPAVENPAARHAIARYYRRHFGFWAKAVRRIKRTLRGDFGA